MPLDRFGNFVLKETHRGGGERDGGARRLRRGAVRGDDNSAFGKDYSAAYYPKVSASWVVSEEPLWKDKAGVVGRVLGDLRLRGAFGAAGTQPGTFDASRLYTSSTGYQNAAGLVPSSFGNPQLKPERSEELDNLGGSPLPAD
jgi:outer membrane receptor protein involved in Fe transport